MVWKTNDLTLDEAKLENYFHCDNGTVCDVTHLSAILVINLSDNEYRLDLTEIPEAGEK